MEILKYFYEEPMPLEALTPDEDPAARGPGRASGPTIPLEALLDGPAYYRGYLAGTNQESGQVGLTTLTHRAAVTAALQAPGAGATWLRGSPDGLTSAEDPTALFWSPGSTGVLLRGPTEELDEAAVHGVITQERREAIPALRAVLDACSVAYFPEPAHDGHDWSLFSRYPLREAIAATLQQHATPNLRRFLLPYQRARSEQKFYFESWQLDATPLPDYIQEV